MHRTHRRVLIVAALTCGVLAAVFLLVQRLAPVRGSGAVFARWVSDATGVRVEVRGPARFTLFPHLGLRLRDIRLGAAPGTSLPDLAHIPRLDLRLAFAPLLRGELVVERLEFYDPTIAFHVGPDGTRNWSFTGGGASAPPDTPQSDAPPREDDDGSITFRAEAIDVFDADITYTDDARHTHFRLQRVRGTLFVPSIDGPFQANGVFVWNGRRVEANLEAVHLAPFLRGESTAVMLALDTTGARLSYQGDLQTRDALRANGVVELEVAAPPRLIPAAPDGATDAARLYATADLTIAGGRAWLAPAHITLGAMEVAGNARVDWRTRPPVFAAAFHAPVLDLSGMLPHPAAADTEASDMPDAPADQSTWEWLRAAEGDVSLAADRVVLGDMTAGRGDLTVRLRGGRLTATFGQAAVAEGLLHGRLTLAAEGAGVAYRGVIAAHGVDVADALRVITPNPRLAGIGSATLHVRGTGRDAAEMFACTDGYGTLTVRKGTLRGVDLAALTGNFARLVIGGLRPGEAETPFRELTGTFVLRDGIIHNDDLVLRAGLLGLTAQGQARLADRTLQYHATLRRPWLRLPIAITGPWDALQVRPFGKAEVDETRRRGREDRAGD